MDINHHKNTRLKALIHLLDVNDPDAFEEVKANILAFGPDIIPSLEEEWIDLKEPGQQSRLLEIIQQLHLEEVYQQLMIWSGFNSLDIKEGYFLASKYLYSEIESQHIENQINAIRKDLHDEMHQHLTPLQKINVLNHILFKVHFFRPGVSKIHQLERHFLNHILDTKRGNTFAFGLLYMILGKEMGIPLYGLKLFDHFILAYMDADSPGEKAFKSEVKFYINPFYRGMVFTEKEIRHFLGEMNTTPSRKYFYPQTNVSIIFDLLTSVKDSCKNINDVARAREVEYLLDGLITKQP